MAKDKNSFVAYIEWIDIFEALDDDEAGRLAKHLWRYVNDLDPKTDDKIVNISFIQMKGTLKRDLKKYESIIERNQINGLKGGRPKKPTGLSGFYNKPKKPDNDSDIVNDSVIVNDNKYKRSLLSEITIEDYPKLNRDYIEGAKIFQKLFIENQKSLGVDHGKTENAKGTWIDDFRLMVEIDKRTKEDLRKVYDFLKVDDFWKPNILSTGKLREKFETILMKANGKQTTKNNRAKLEDLANSVTG